MSSKPSTIGRRLELALTGRLPDDVRRNLRIETIASIAYGIFFAAALSFMPVVLRRLGASSTLLAIYTAQTYLGSVLSTLGVLLMRRRRPLAFAATCWLLARSLLLPTLLIAQAELAAGADRAFWLLEGIPRPGLRAHRPGDLPGALSRPRAVGRARWHGAGDAAGHAAGWPGARSSGLPGAVPDRRRL